MDQFTIVGNTLPIPNLDTRNMDKLYVAPKTKLETILCAILEEVLKIEKIGIHDNFFKLGGDSIISIQLVVKARQQGLYFDVKDIFNYPTVNELSKIIKSENHTFILDLEQNTPTKKIPLTAMQQWLFKEELNYCTEAKLLCISHAVNIPVLSQTFRVLLSYHDALRFQYRLIGKNWVQECLALENIPDIWTTVDLSLIPDKDLALVIEKEAAMIQKSFIIDNMPLIKIIFFDCGTDRLARLLIVIHELVIDFHSWHILLEDLDILYNQLLQKQDTTFSYKNHSYQQWAHALINYAQSDLFKQEFSYWQQIEESIRSFPTNLQIEESSTLMNRKTLLVSLSEIETKNLLQDAHKAYRTNNKDILLTALSLAFGDWSKNYSLSLCLEGSGRENIIPGLDLTRMIGRFTTFFPVHLELSHPLDLGDCIKTVKETLREIPQNGIGYGIIKYISSHSFNISSQPSIYFSYLEQWDCISNSLFDFKEETIEPFTFAHRNNYLIELEIVQKGGSLQIYCQLQYQTLS